MMSSEPFAQTSFRQGKLKQKVEEALHLLEHCCLCPRRCGINRVQDEKAVCHSGRKAFVSSLFPHFGEENCLRGWRGSGTIFFSHCNLRCVFCFHPDTLVPTDQGLLRMADLFEQGESEAECDGGRVNFINGNVRVVTREGAWAPIAKAFRHHFVGELVMIKPFNCPPLLLTPNHELFAVSKTEPHQVVKVRAGCLTKEHYLIVPKRIPRGMKVDLDAHHLLLSVGQRFRKSPMRRVPTAQLSPLFAQSLTSYALAEITGYHPAYIRKLRGQWRRDLLPNGDNEEWAENEITEEDGHVRFKTERRPGIPARITVDERLAWLLGIYCAEGHVSSQKGRPNSHRLVFSFGHAESNLADRARQWLYDLFGVQVEMYQRRTAVTVEVGKASLAMLFARLCGRGAAGKEVPSIVAQGTSEVLRTFLQGVLDGDGCDRGSHLVVNTVSERFAMGLFEIGLLLGVLPSFHRWQPPPTTVIEKRRVNQAPLYYVKFPKVDPGTGKRRSRWREMENHTMVPLHKIQRVSYEGPVFNLEIDDADHSYLTPFVAVSNCQNFDISQGGGGKEASAKEIASMMIRLQDLGCHNINFVTPEHVVSQILEATLLACEQGLAIPIVYNTSAYDAVESLRLLEGVVDIYMMPDFKFFDPEPSLRYLKTRDYPQAAKAAILEMHRQVGPLTVDPHGLAQKGVLVRHLVMPGLLDQTQKIMHFLAKEVSLDTYVNVMMQYRPAGRVGNGQYHEQYPEINRPLAIEEYKKALQIAEEEGLHRFDSC